MARGESNHAPFTDEKETPLSMVNSTMIGYAVAAVALVALVLTKRRPRRKADDDGSRLKISPFDRLMYFLQSRASKVVVLSLIANTMIAQLLYNSAGQLVLSNTFLLGYLIGSAASSTLAFALFEISTILQLHDLMALDPSIALEIGAHKLIRRGFGVLAVSSLINFISVFYFLALAWHAASAKPSPFPLDHLPEPLNYVYYGFHAAAYTAVLFMAGIFGERPKSSKEIALSTERRLEQDAMEAWELQKQAQIAKMKQDGQSISPVAAALASPETATRVALLDIAMEGNLSSLDAAIVNVGDQHEAQRTILEKLAAALQHGTSLGEHQRNDDPDEDEEDEERGEQTGADTPSGLLRFTSESAEIRAYELPGELTYTTMDSIRGMAKILGVTRHQDIAQAMKHAQMAPAGGVANGQAHGTKNIAVWQILALVEAGLLPMPSNVTKRSLVPVE